MLNDRKLELLKRIAFLADRMGHYSQTDFSNIRISVNSLLEDSELLTYALRMLEIPYQEYMPKNEDIDIVPPTEVNFRVGTGISIKALFLLTLIAKEVYGHKVLLYIIYRDASEFKNEVTFGSYLEKDKKYNCTSKAISIEEIISLPMETIAWARFAELFPRIQHPPGVSVCHILSDYEADLEKLIGDFDFDEIDFDEEEEM